MKVGLIVYSQTGNTLSVAEKIKKRLEAAGHVVNLERVVSDNENPSVAGKVLLKGPDPSAYEGLVFAAPVQAFSLAEVMSAYLKQVPALEGKKTACFVTQQFPRPWMGGNRAIAKMKMLCAAKGTEVCGTGIVNWGNEKRLQMIDDVVESIGALF